MVLVQSDAPKCHACWRPMRVGTIDAQGTLVPFAKCDKCATYAHDFTSTSLGDTSASRFRVFIPSSPDVSPDRGEASQCSDG